MQIASKVRSKIGARSWISAGRFAAVPPPAKLCSHRVRSRFLVQTRDNNGYGKRRQPEPGCYCHYLRSRSLLRGTAFAWA